MNFAFIIFKYFPYGGLQLDFRRILEEILQRGHAVTVLYEQWEGERIAGAQYQQFQSTVLTNWGKAQDFERKTGAFLKERHFDLVFGFNRMAGLDVYFAADNCFAATSRKKHPVLCRIIPRYRVFERQERSIFAVGQKSTILYLAARQKQDYQTIYGTEENRFHLLPPGLAPEYHYREPEVCRKIREEVRKEFQIPENHPVMIQVCSSFSTKGLDRSLTAFSRLPDELRKHWHFLAVGKDNPKKYRKFLTAAGIREQVFFTGSRSDVWKLLYAADLMIHPARNEATGGVLAEAISCGLPVITTACCGYAPMIAEAGGMVLAEPFCQTALDRQLQLLASPAVLTEYKCKAESYSSKMIFQNRQKITADLLERMVKNV